MPAAHSRSYLTQFVRPGHLPAEIRHVVLSVRMNQEPMMIIVEAQQQRAVVLLGTELQAQSFGREPFPGRYVAHADAEIAQLRHAVHDSLLFQTQRAGQGHGRCLRMEFLTRILPSLKVRTSQPRASTRAPSVARVPVKIHSQTPRSPAMTSSPTGSKWASG